MWTLKHLIFKYFEFLNFFKIFKKFNSSTPNLSSFLPVEIFLSVFELIFGLKTEIFNNLFLGFELQLKSTLSQKMHNEITNFYIPGFNRTYDGSSIGAGFRYTISYLIPVVKK